MKGVHHCRRNAALAVSKGKLPFMLCSTPYHTVPESKYAQLVERTDHFVAHSRIPVHIRAWTQAEPSPDLLVERRGSNNSASTSSDEATAAYIHLPFCKRKCFYCDFPVIATGSRTDSPEIRDTMKVQPLLRMCAPGIASLE